MTRGSAPPRGAHGDTPQHGAGAPRSSGPVVVFSTVRPTCTIGLVHPATPDRWHVDALAGDSTSGDPRPGTRDLSRTALGVLDIELVRVGPDAVVLRMPAPVRAEAAALLVLAESAASTAAGIAAGEGRRAFGAELDAAFTWAADPRPGSDVACRATPLRVDADLQVWRVEVRTADGASLLEGRCSLGVVDAP